MRQRTAFLLLVALLVLALVRCSNEKAPSTSHGVTTKIGPEGGEVTAADGKARLVVPPGALSAAVDIRLAPSAGHPAGCIGPAYTCSPSGQRFLLPVELSIEVDLASVPKGADVSSLQVGKAVDDEWHSVAGSRADPAGGQVAASISTFSTYGVVEPRGGEADPLVYEELNQRMCRLVEAVRDLNTGQLLMMKGYQKGFTIPLVPAPYVLWSASEKRWITEGALQAADAVTALGEELDSLEGMAARHGLPSPVLGSGTTQRSKDAVELTQTAYKAYLEYQIWGPGGKGLRDKYNSALLEQGEKMVDEQEETILAFIRHCITSDPAEALSLLDLESTMHATARKYGIPGLRYRWRDAYLPDHRTEAMELASYELARMDMKSLEYLWREMTTVMGWEAFRNSFIPNQAVEFTSAGLGMAWDAVVKVVTPAWDSVKSNFGAATDVLLDLSYYVYDPGAPADGSEKADSTEADVVVLLYPDRMDELPVLVMADRLIDGSLTIPEVFEDTYTLCILSRGNYPMMFRDVPISEESREFRIPAPEALPGVTDPRFPVSEPPEVLEALDPPPYVPNDYTWTGVYRASHSVEVSGATRPQHGFWESHRHSTSAEFELEFTRERFLETTVEVPYRVHRTLSSSTNGEDPDIGHLEFAPSSFHVNGVLEWLVRRELNSEGEWCFEFTPSVVSEETRGVRVTAVTSDGTFVVTESQEFSAFGGGLSAVPGRPEDADEWHDCDMDSWSWREVHRDDAPDGRMDSEHRSSVEIEFVSSEIESDS